MHKLGVLAVLLAFVLALTPTRPVLPQASPESVQILCDPQAPGGPCTPDRCDCTTDTLEVTFDGFSRSVLVMIPFEAGAPIETTVILDAKSPPIQGWSYGPIPVVPPGVGRLHARAAALLGLVVFSVPWSTTRRSWRSRA